MLTSTQKNTTIYEATLQFSDWVARIDVLRMNGSRIELIEVKSKSFDSLAGDINEQWPTTRNSGKSAETPKIKTIILPYLQYVASQTLLARHAYPDWQVIPYLMVVDKAVKASVDGLNQMFKIHRIGQGDEQQIFAKPSPGVLPNSIGVPVLKAIDVTDFVNEIIDGTVQTPDPIIGAHCRGCEFFCAKPDETNRSGFHECWEKVTHVLIADIGAKRPITKLYHPGGEELKGLFQNGIRWMDEIKAADFEIQPSKQGLSRTARQYLHLFGTWAADKPFEFDAKPRRAIGFLRPMPIEWPLIHL